MHVELWHKDLGGVGLRFQGHKKTILPDYGRAARACLSSRENVGRKALEGALTTPILREQ